MLSAKNEVQAFLRINLVKINSLKKAIGDKGKDLKFKSKVGLKIVFCKKQRITKEKSTSLPFIYFEWFLRCLNWEF